MTLLNRFQGRNMLRKLSSKTYAMMVYLVGGSEEIPISESWRVITLRDEEIGSSKVFTVPAGQEWEILWVWVGFTTDATVGARQLDVHLGDGVGNTLGEWQVAITQLASLTYYYLIAPAMPDLLALRDGVFLSTPLPPTLFLSAGQSLQVWDNNMVAAAGDTLVAEVQIARRTV
jgi:hypothetical protein